MNKSEHRGAAQFVAPLMMVQAFLLLFRIGKQPLWQDEANMSFGWSLAPWETVRALFEAYPEQHPLYYLLMRGWIVFGTSEAALRSLSAAFALISTPLIYLLARRLGGERVAKISVILFVVSPFSLYYGQEARPYALLGFLSLLSTLCLVQWCQEASRRAMVGYVLASILGVYTHFFFLYLMLAHTVAVLLRREAGRTPTAVGVISAQALVGLAYVPWGIFLVVNFPTGGQDWKGIEHIVFGVPYTFLRFSVGYAEFLANYQWQGQVWALARQDALVLVPAIAVFGALAFSGLREAVSRGWNGIVIVTGLAVPMLGAVATAVVTILVGERYFIVCFPFYVILLAFGLERMSRIGPRWLAPTATVLLAGVTLKSLGDHYFRDAFGKEQWREVAEVIRADWEQGMPVFVMPPPAATPFRYYFQGQGGDVIVAEWEAFPSVSGTRDFWLVAAYTEDPDAIAASFASTHRATVQRLFPKESGIWLLRFERDG